MRTTGLTVAAFAVAGLLACSSEPPPSSPPSPAPQVAPEPPGPWDWRDGPLDGQSWTAEAFAEARRRDCPVLLYLAAPGAEGLFPGDNAWLSERVVLIQVDPFRRPDIARRFATGGWPALVFLDPEGRTFAQGTDISPANVPLFIRRLVEYYQTQRSVIETKLRRRTRPGPVPRAVAVDQVYRAAVAAFDSLHGGFGTAAKFPEIEVLRFLLAYHARQPQQGAWPMVRRSLEAVLEGPMRDREAGGVFAFSYTPDWRSPVGEKDGADQAGLIVSLLEAAPYGGARYTEAASDLFAYIAEYLFDVDLGVFKGRQLRRDDGTWWTDPIIYADRNALLISACVQLALESTEVRAAALARRAADFVVDRGIDHRGAVYHCWADGAGSTPALLDDQILTAAALLDLYELSGETRFKEKAALVMGFMEKTLFESSIPAFFDRPPIYGATGESPLFPYRDGRLPAANPGAAELYLRLGQGDRAQRLLAAALLADAPDRSSSAHARVLLEHSSSHRSEP